jgi:DNA repair exonuclease SbcCD ATPase subunit
MTSRPKNRRLNVAFKLTAADLKERDEMIASVKEKQAKLNEEIAVFNDALDAAQDRLEEFINDLNGAISDLRDFIENKQSQFEGEYDDKSEKWQEGDKGQAVMQWIETFSNITLYDEEIDLPSSIPDVIDIDALDEVEALESEPSY